MERKNVIITIEVIALVVVIAVVASMVFPNTLANISQGITDLTKDDLRHPCQKAALDHFNMYKDGANIIEFYGFESEEYKKYWKEFQSRDKSTKNLFEANNCESTYSQWVTPEFQKEMQALLDEGF